jgi:hypothetical protein
VLSKRPDIVYALPSKRSRRKKAAPADVPKAPLIAEARDSRRIKRQPKLTRTIVDNSTPDIPEQQRRGEAADRLFQEIKRRVAEGR